MSNGFELLIGMNASIVLLILVSLNVIRTGVQNTRKELKILDKLEPVNKNNLLKKNQIQFNIAHNLLMDFGDTLSNKKGLEQCDDMKLHFKSLETYYKNANEKPVNLAQYKKELQDPQPIEKPIFKIVK
ncbi:hypothetical protein CJF42_21135 [Pseudoalteromonas sp. NBT06-2]|uniref:hypothetical protein n=1 Tax=Pseudoalteromonas sp. NBT06-2 TaxID=2025950 RepID=UPI000BA60A55|nr:hypothetical protein [Pseudoalteromonas sp. NBT06-2]PAJ72459.1 hypothetical protein CJF42_21135 [Pseudoalteromonas sp. NBT06-2]